MSEGVPFSVSEKPKLVITLSRTGAVLSGNSVTLTCRLTPQSTGWKFYWNTSAQSTDTMPETNSYTISSVGESNRGRYQCRAGRGDPVYYTEDSDELQLDVTEKNKPVLIPLVDSPALIGNSVSLLCRLKPQFAEWKFYWKKDTQSNETETAGRYDSSHSSFTYSSYTISSVSVSDEGQYKCRAGRGNPVYYTHYSTDFTLNVIESPKPTVRAESKPPEFSGESVTLRCDIKGGGTTEWTYEWFMNNRRVFVSRHLQTFTVEYDDQVKYTCRGERRRDLLVSNMSDPVTLSVSEKPKAVITSSRTGALLSGNSVTLTCTLNVQPDGWKFYWNTSAQSTDTMPETKSYTIRSVSESNRGGYKCRAGRGNPVYYTHYSDELQLDVTGE
ncbi:leukocyte immunoglobulin-like receptor subfamily A member 3 [Clarias gariepinus]